MGCARANFKVCGHAGLLHALGIGGAFVKRTPGCDASQSNIRLALDTLPEFTFVSQAVRRNLDVVDWDALASGARSSPLACICLSSA